MTTIRRAINRVWIDNEQYISSSDILDVMREMIVNAYDNGYEDEVVGLAALSEILSFSLIADGFNEQDKTTE